ncbi:metal-dependent transcriptional regulator [Alkalibacter saccharofermentans]|uniref:Iron (Metal) dependent repressor, DtxR family n=1 Tax=Alkalibacter saccharofermentans DSM 14828 TaxID=1120975 RepID=A0A1M4VZ68_9FIRM|nr:metal-dependent transcriptional regulator [Alkalibacter saccharofermentans]SHE74249.1 iron (metal) dependent repressor, DtxR family [Alkalibacter saccharofermentans DSM 14828]
MKVQESRENYLETILLLQKELGQVRSIDIAHKLEYTKASISRAMSLLKKDNLITMGKSGIIELTEEGQKKAAEIYDRHRAIKDFLINIGVSEKTAEEDACRMEHVISNEAFEKIKKYNDK